MMTNFENAKKDPNLALRIATVLYELYADQHGLTLESITVTDKTPCGIES